MGATSGIVVIVNGPSSAGKSSVCDAMDERLRERGVRSVVTGWDEIVAGSMPDDLIDMTAGMDARPHLFGPDAYFRTEPGRHADVGVRYVATGPDTGRFDFGPAVDAAERAYHLAVAALAASAEVVLVDEVCRGAAQRDHWDEALGDTDALWVGLHADDDTIRARESARGDRLPGIGVWTSGFVHDAATYDVELDSSTAGPDDLAATVHLAMRDRWPDRTR